MAFPSPSRPCSPIRIVSVHLLDAAGQLLRVLFLDREGHISAQPHYVPRAEALILASNSRSCSGPRPLCGCSEAPWPEAFRLRLSGVATPLVDNLGFLEQQIDSLDSKRVDAAVLSKAAHANGLTV